MTCRCAMRVHTRRQPQSHMLHSFGRFGHSPSLYGASDCAEDLLQALVVCTLHTYTCTIAQHMLLEAIRGKRRSNANVQRHSTWAAQGDAHVATGVQIGPACASSTIWTRQSARESAPRRHTCDHSLACACARMHTAPSALRYKLPAISRTHRQG